MRPTIGSLLALMLAATAASGSPRPVTTTVTFGPANAVGIGASRVSEGRALGLEVEAHSGPGASWILRAGRTTFSRTGGLSPALAGALLSGGQLYSLFLPEGEPSGFEAVHLQVGLRHARAYGRVRPFVQAAAGASLVRDEGAALGSWLSSDRRPSPEPVFRSPVANEPVPSFSLGVGLEAALPWQLSVSTSVSADFTPTHELVGAMLPVRFGATWPSAPSVRSAAGANEASPRLRASAGWSALRSPARIEGDAGQGHSLAAELELPVRARFALSLVGEHATREMQEPLYRQQVDQFGNFMTVRAGSYESSLATTMLTLGLRAHQPLGPVTLSLRAGAGWGYTSGFGASVRNPQGAYIDGNGQWVPLFVESQVGAGRSAGGWAYATSAGLETRLVGPATVFAETGFSAVELEREDVRTVPLRFGIALR